MGVRALIDNVLKIVRGGRVFVQLIVNENYLVP